MTLNQRTYLLLTALTFLVPTLFPATKDYAPGIAILLGALYTGLIGNPYRETTSKIVSPLLGLVIVGLGFGMNLPAVLQAGGNGFIYTIIGIAMGLSLGILLGKKLHLTRDTTLLISVGTSICGGSAIAAVAPVLKAKANDIALATATVFILNGIALLLFPAIGHALELDQTQFGTWAALAIHDTSSVVGASMAYGTEALEIGTTIKMARALWIVPVACLIGFLIRKDDPTGPKAKVRVPWFIPTFLLAAVVTTFKDTLHIDPKGLAIISSVSKSIMVTTLFLIGTNLDIRKVKEVGIKPLIHGVVLWFILATIWLSAIYFKIV